MEYNDPYWMSCKSTGLSDLETYLFMQTGMLPEELLALDLVQAELLVLDNCFKIAMGANPLPVEV
jgi:hypothetical protein